MDPASMGFASMTPGNRRRLMVFGIVFALGLIGGMAWNLLRPAEYRAVARVELKLPPRNAATMPAAASTATPAGTPAGTPQHERGGELVAQAQRLGSRPLLEEVERRLAAAGMPAADGGVDGVSRLQSMIGVEPVPGSAVVDLTATGAPPELLARALNELIAIYRDQLLAAYDTDADERLQQAREELERLARAAAARRESVERFRGGAGILSTERDENESVARTRGLATALSGAMEKRATAEARMRALQEAVRGGQGALSARDDPTLASLESRASALREELRELGRSYTDELLALDPRARALRARLGELESQIAQRRVSGQQEALARAQEDVAAAAANVERLQAQMASERGALRSFSARFAQAKALEEDLEQIEIARRGALERVARLEASERAGRPGVDVLQPATAPTAPWRPDYLRDAALVLAGSFALGLLAMGFVELFNRAPAPAGAAPVTVVLPAWPAFGAGAPGGLLRGEGGAAAPVPSLPVPPTEPGPTALPAPTLRPLSQEEAAALLAAARGPARVACTLWLLGVDEDEIGTLKQGDVDRATGRLRVGGAWARELELPPWLLESLDPDGAAGDAPRLADAPLLADASGRVPDPDDLCTMLVCAALDAGLPCAAELTPARLRHTVLAWLVREGARFADLPARVGRIDSTTVAALAALAGDAPRRGLEDIGPAMPAVRLSP
jgi:uncharacterized protein involved in exopolysaccharide biosynthesis